jgi:low temperature requirement protein LtrA
VFHGSFYEGSVQTVEGSNFLKEQHEYLTPLLQRQSVRKAWGRSVKKRAKSHAPSTLRFSDTKYTTLMLGLVDYSWAFLAIFWVSIGFDICAFILPVRFNFYIISMIPWDVNHLIERFNRLTLISFGQNVLASVAQNDVLSPINGVGVYERATFTVFLTIMLRMLFFDVGNYDVTKMSKNGHALRRGYMWGCLWVLALLCHAVSVNLVGSTLSGYVISGTISSYTLIGGLAAALFFLVVIQFSHHYAKTPPLKIPNGQLGTFVALALFYLGKKRMKVLIKLLGACVMLPFLAISPTASYNWVLIMVPAVVVPAVVVLEYLGYSRGVFFEKPKPTSGSPPTAASTNAPK